MRGGSSLGGRECARDGGSDCGVGSGSGSGSGSYASMMKGFDDRPGKADLGGGLDAGFDSALIRALLFGKWEAVGVKAGLRRAFGEL